jgi:hypothetical protein
LPLTQLSHLRADPDCAVCRFRGRNIGIIGRADRDSGLSTGKSISCQWPDE